MLDTKKLRRERAQANAAMLMIAARATNAGRDMTGEEAAKFAELFDAQDALRRRIEAAERGRQADDRIDSSDTPAMRAFGRWLRGSALHEHEWRALNAETLNEGGALVPPPEFVADILADVDDMVFIRERGTIRTVSRPVPLGIPTVETQASDAEWTTEIGTGSDDSTMKLGKRQLAPHPIAKRIKVSKTLLRGAPNAADIVRERIAYKVAVTLEKSYLTGTGASQPLGVFTASDNGIPTTRDVSTGNTSTALTFDGLIEAKFSTKSQYWANAAWLFHRDAVKQISKLKDGNGAYVWRPSERDGEPDRLLGHALMASEYCPNTFTTGQYVGVFGDWRFYHMLDALDFTLQRLVELYAETNQDQFLARYEGDGAPALAEAFARVKLA